MKRLFAKQPYQSERSPEGRSGFEFSLTHSMLCLLFFLGTYSAFAKTITVDPAGPVATIAQALEIAADGDEILIRPGTYYEAPLRIEKQLHLRGEGFPKIDGDNDAEILIIAADGVTVEGLQIQNIGNSYLKDRAGIRVQRKRDFVIRNNRLINTFFGIYLEYSADGLVEDNVILGEAVNEASSGNAIHAWYCERVKIRNNEVRRHRDGIYFEFVNNSTVEDNFSAENVRYGLHFMFSNDDTYTNNTFRDNGAGVAVMFSRRINMINNRFEHNWGRAAYGLLLKEIFDAEITQNIFDQNTVGILIEGSNRVNYYENEFRRNGWAIRMSGGCLDNVFTKNNFRSNTLDLVVNSKVNNNSFHGNYWSEYSGYDLDRDGIGDVPHRPVKLFSFILSRSPEAIVLLRSLFVDLVNFAEKVSPVFTPANVLDEKPRMQPVEGSRQ